MQEALLTFSVKRGHCEQVYLPLHTEGYRKNNQYYKKTWFLKQRTIITTKSKGMHLNRVRALQPPQIREPASRNI